LGADLIKVAEDAVRAAEVRDEILGFGHVLLPPAQQFFIPMGVMEASALPRGAGAGSQPNVARGTAD